MVSTVQTIESYNKITSLLGTIKYFVLNEHNSSFSPGMERSLGRDLLVFAVGGRIRLIGIEATKGSISHGETLSGL